jgi:hypothetical protein
MKKILLLFTLLALIFLGAKAQTTEYWNLEGNSNATTSHFLGTTNLNPVIFKTNNTERMQLLPDKPFLGIGLSNPQSTLHLHYQAGMTSPTFQKLLQLTTDATGNADSNGFSIFSDFTTKDVLFKQQEEAKFVIEGPGGGLVIAPNGDIGIGMEPPSWMSLPGEEKPNLFIAGSCVTSNLQTASANITNALFTNFFSAANANISGTTTANTLSAQSATIASTLTARTLNVQQHATITGTATANALSAQSATIANTLTAGTLSATNANITNLTGTTTANNVKVTGLLCAKEVRVQLSGNPCWPDYVFAEDYHLLPLSEVEQFINQNHHLPKIPSAAQVEANGVNIGEMNALLLLKVEELTLYLLQQEKKMLDLQEQINELKNR